MQEINNDMLRLNLIVDEVLKSIPNPFGSFEKATYAIYNNQHGLIYSFTTTCRNAEDSINLMIERYKEMFFHCKSFKVWQIQGGIKKIVYQEVYYKK